MADEEQEAADRVGPFRLGERLEEFGPGLGQLYAAWQADGFPVLLLMPGSAVDWQPERPWRVQLSFDPAWSAISLKVEQSPFSPDTSEMANILVLTTAAITRAEDSPRVREHLARPVEEPSRGPRQRARARHVPHWGMALAGLAVLALGAGGLLFFTRASDPVPRSDNGDAPHHMRQMASFLIDAKESDTKAPYPLPAKPFLNQATPPCHTKRGEVAINDGCWVSLEQKPPCLEEQAEYKGRCYLPVARREQTPRSARP